MNRSFIKWPFGIITGLVIILCVAWILSGFIVSRGPQNYIAHGGGAIDGVPVTNSLEAVENSIAHGVKYIELDLQLTSDNKLVATHDWGTFRSQTEGDWGDSEVPSYNEFRKMRICGKYKPMTYQLIDSVFKKNPDLWLVTDKITDLGVMERFLPDLKDRIIVESFSPQQYSEGKNRGFKVFRSYHNLTPGGINAVEINSRRLIYQHFIPTEFAVYSNRRISSVEADSIFKSDKRIKYIYVDYFEDSFDSRK